MTEITPQTFPNAKGVMTAPHSLLKNLPSYLKNPANYDKIQYALLETLASKHSHSEIQDWAKCKSCQEKVFNHKRMMKKLGFKTPAHYQIWKKIMNIMLADPRKLDRTHKIIK